MGGPVRIETLSDVIASAQQWVSPKLFRSATAVEESFRVRVFVRTTRWSLGLFNRRIERDLQELYAEHGIVGIQIIVKVYSFG